MFLCVCKFLYIRKHSAFFPTIHLWKALKLLGLIVGTGRILNPLHQNVEQMILQLEIN